MTVFYPAYCLKIHLNNIKPLHLEKWSHPFYGHVPYKIPCDTYYKPLLSLHGPFCVKKQNKTATRGMLETLHK